MQSSFRFSSLLVFLGIAAAAQNIVKNSGFEYGLSCYTNWVWSTTGQDYKGDYKFSLSSDAHSGAYSLEMSCQPGLDCAKAAIVSYGIPTVQGQNYKLTYYSKCPAGGVVYTYLPSTATGSKISSAICNGNWALNTVTFSAPAADSFTFNLYSAGAGWARLDDVVLTYADGSAPREIALHPGVRNVSTSGQVLNVDGAPYLALGFFDVPYADLQAAAAAGANTVQAIAGRSDANCFNTARGSYLDRAYELGLAFLPESSYTARMQAPPVFSAVIPQFAPHLANIGWFLADEPDQADVPWYYVPPATFTSEYSTVKTATSLPVIADFQRGARGLSALNELAPYNGSVDMWMAEPYGPDFSHIDNAVNVFNTIQRRPIWLAQDVIASNLIVPKTYWAVIRGATGIIYFDWAAYKANAPALAAAQQSFTELKQLKNAIFGQNLNSQVTAPAGIGYMARNDSGTTYIFAVNPTSTTVQGNFSVAGLAAGAQISVLFENRTLTASAGRFSDSFAGVSRHVYAIKSASPGIPGVPIRRRYR